MLTAREYFFVWAAALATLLVLAHFAAAKEDRSSLRLGIGGGAFANLCVVCVGSSLGQGDVTAWLAPIVEEAVRTWCVFRLLADSPLTGRSSTTFAAGSGSLEPSINLATAVFTGALSFTALGAAGLILVTVTPFAAQAALSLLMCTLATYGARAWVGFAVCATLHALYNNWGLAVTYEDNAAHYARLTLERLAILVPLSVLLWFAIRRRSQADETGL